MAEIDIRSALTRLQGETETVDELDSSNTETQQSPAADQQQSSSLSAPNKRRQTRSQSAQVVTPFFFTI